jgi:hypothetical protein
MTEFMVPRQSKSQFFIMTSNYLKYLWKDVFITSRINSNKTSLVIAFVKIGIWALLKKFLTLQQIFTLQIFLDEYSMNREWNLISMTSYRSAGKFPCCPNDTYPSVVFQIVLQRHSGSYTAIAVAPAVGE